MSDAFNTHSMFYHTHHPSPFFQFHPFTSSTTLHLSTTPPSSLPSLPHFPYLLLPRAETEMKCVEAALKSRYRKDTTMKLSPQTFFSDETVSTCEDFVVDDFLDFSHEETLVEEKEEEKPQQQKLQNHDSSFVSPQHENQSKEICNLSFNAHFGSSLTSEHSIPDEEVANLEWLSYFVEDSYSEYPKENLAQKAPEPGSTSSDESGIPISAKPFFKISVPAKARSKRTRTGVRDWLLQSHSLTKSSSSTSSSTTTSSYVTQKLEKNAKKRTKSEGKGFGVAPRRCTHCGVQKTPQWRTGPLGVKTLCNACGVRYKSGRLLPEYRPARSPTFSSELHSNHHHKVLEMRRKKEVTGESLETGSMDTYPVIPDL